MNLPIISLAAPPVIQPEGLPRKLLRSLGNNEYLLEIDNSSFSEYTTCPRKAFYKLLHSRSGESSYALTYGKAIHKSLEFFYRTKKDTGSFPSVEATIDAGMAILLETPCKPEEWRTPDALRLAITKYIARYEALDTWDILGVELPFAMPLATYEINATIPFSRRMLVADTDGLPEEEKDGAVFVKKLHVSWTGVIDLITREGNEVWTHDHKTSSIEGESFWKQFELSPQFLGYCESASEILQMPVTGTKVNALIGRKPTKTGSSLELLRRNFYYSKAHTDEWRMNAKNIISDFIHHLTSGTFPMFLSACVGKYGTCPFHDVCIMPPENRMTMLYSNQYVNNVWNPLD